MQEKIASLPIEGELREVFREVAEAAFEECIERVAPESPETVMAMWNVDDYINWLLQPEMLPIETEYALSLAETFIMHYLSDILEEAEESNEVVSSVQIH